MSAAVTNTDAAKPASRLWPILRSLLINVAGSWLAYKLTAPAFAPQSVAPLLAAVAVPALWLGWTLWKRRALDGVAVIQLVMTGLSVLIGLLARDQHASLVGMAFQPLGLGLAFGLSALAGRPLMAVLARQAVSGDDAEAGARFDATVAAVPAVRRGLALISGMWTLALAAETGVRLAALPHMQPASYIVAANVLSYAVPGLLVWASLAIGRRLEARLRAQRRLASEGAAS